MKMKRNQVILIYGLPASGKYTVAKQIQEQCGGVLLDNHYFYDMFIGKIEVANDSWFEYVGHVSKVRRAFLGVLRKYYPRKKAVRYIFTGVYLRGEKGPARLQKFARDINADFIPVELNVCKEVLLDRCDTELRRKREKLSDKDKYNKLLKQWIPDAYHSRHHNKLVLDSSNLSLEETVKRVKKHLKQFD
jgi:chloramphenicol 3-O-phosphotransferase